MDSRSDGNESDENCPRVAYLTSAYPSVSHTFILREVEALRALGLEVSTCSIRRTPPEQHRGPTERAAARTTFNVLDAARRPMILLEAQIAGLRTPRRYFSAFRLACNMRSPGLRAFFYQMIYFVEATVLARHLVRIRASYLHNHFASASATVAMLAALIAGIRFSYTLHGPADFEDPRRWRLDVKTRQATFVACISDFSRSQAMLHSDPADWPKLNIIHCGVIPELYLGKSDEENRPADGLRLVFVGRLAPVKGLRVLLDAFAQILQDVPGLHLTIVGDGPERGWLERTAQSFADAVTLEGYRSQDEVAAILTASDVLVLPSFAEGVPVVLMEAMASGKPVIATQVAGVPELVENEISGFLVAPGNAEMLADRIKRLTDPTLRARMGAAGRDKVTAEFDVRNQAARLTALFGRAV